MNATECLNFMIIVLISLHVTLKPTSASITQKDVQSCISEVKKRLENQQNTAKKRFFDLKTRKVNDMKEQRDERQDNLVAFIQNEKNILSTLKQSAIQDNFNVTMCNDTTTVYDLISNSFQSSAEAILADYRGIVERNHTQNLVVVDRIALNYRQLQQKLDTCPQPPLGSDCFDEVEDDCEITVYKNDILDLESSYYSAAERLFGDFKAKINSLSDRKLGEVQSFSNEMKSCYRNVENINNLRDGDQPSNGGTSISSLEFMIILPFLYQIFY